MCSKYEVDATIEEIESYFKAQPTTPQNCPSTPLEKITNTSFLTPESVAIPNRNIRPTDQVPLIIKQKNTSLKIVDTARWWFASSWANYTRPDKQFPMFNARSESANRKKTFKDSYYRSRGLQAASGYYEWKKLEHNKKAPYHLYLPDNRLYGFASLHSIVKNPHDNTSYRTCTLLTGEASGSLEQIHARIPLIMPEYLWDSWLDPNQTNNHTISEMMTEALHFSLNHINFSPVSPPHAPKAQEPVLF